MKNSFMLSDENVANFGEKITCSAFGFFFKHAIQTLIYSVTLPRFSVHIFFFFWKTKFYLNQSTNFILNKACKSSFVSQGYNLHLQGLQAVAAEG